MYSALNSRTSRAAPSDTFVGLITWAPHTGGCTNTEGGGVCVHQEGGGVHQHRGGGCAPTQRGGGVHRHRERGGGASLTQRVRERWDTTRGGGGGGIDDHHLEHMNRPCRIKTTPYYHKVKSAVDTL